MRKRDRGIEVKGTEELFDVLESKVISQRLCEKSERGPHY